MGKCTEDDGKSILAQTLQLDDFPIEEDNRGKKAPRTSQASQVKCNEKHFSKKKKKKRLVRLKNSNGRSRQKLEPKNKKARKIKNAKMVQGKIRAQKKKMKSACQVENLKGRSRQKLEQQRYCQGNLNKGVSLEKPNKLVHE